MIDKNLTCKDNEIKKALECCINDDCDNCPDTFGNCEHNAMRNALDLINRKEAENQNLKGHLEQLKSRYDNARAEIERLNCLVVKEHEKKKIISEIFTRIKKHSFEDTRLKEEGGLERVNIVFRDDVNKCLQDFLKEWLSDIE